MVIMTITMMTVQNGSMLCTMGDTRYTEETCFSHACVHQLYDSHGHSGFKVMGCWVGKFQVGLLYNASQGIAGLRTRGER
jgi:hypothetical protein